MSNYTDEEFELDCIDALNATYFLPSSEQATRRIIADRNMLKQSADMNAEALLLLLGERDALKAEVERLTADLMVVRGHELYELRDRLAAAEKVCAAVKHQHYEDATHVAPTEAEVMVATALAEWEALRKEFTND